MDGSLKLKKVARAAYLRRLNQEAQKSEFQEDYEESLAYVNACTVEISPEELREKIASRAAAYFGSAFRGEIATPGYYISDPNNTWQQSEMDRLIEDHVAKSYSSYYCQNKYYLEFINSSRSYRDDFAAQIANLARFSWDDPNVLENKQVFLFCRQMYMNFLGAVMPTALRSKFRIGILVTVEQQQLLAEHIVELGMQTFRKLEIDTMPWMNVKVIKSAIDNYNCVVYPMDENKLPGFSQSDVSLQKALITISVGEAFDSCCSETERSILALTAAIKEMKQKQP